MFLSLLPPKIKDEWLDFQSFPWLPGPTVVIPLSG